MDDGDNFFFRNAHGYCEHELVARKSISLVNDLFKNKRSSVLGSNAMCVLACQRSVCSVAEPPDTGISQNMIIESVTDNKVGHTFGGMSILNLSLSSVHVLILLVYCIPCSVAVASPI